MLCIFWSMLFQHTLTAQDSTAAQTLFGKEAILSLKDLGFYAAPTYGITQMDGSTSLLFNLRSGLSIRDKFSVGGYFNTTLDEISPLHRNNSSTYLDYWTMGGFVEYTLFPKKLVHITLPVLFGYGEVELDEEGRDEYYEEGNFFQIEPMALLEINLHKYVRFNLGAGYRFVGPINNQDFDQSDISGLTGNIGLKVGLFR